MEVRWACLCFTFPFIRNIWSICLCVLNKYFLFLPLYLSSSLSVVSLYIPPADRFTGNFLSRYFNYWYYSFIFKYLVWVLIYFSPFCNFFDSRIKSHSFSYKSLAHLSFVLNWNSGSIANFSFLVQIITRNPTKFQIFLSTSLYKLLLNYHAKYLLLLLLLFASFLNYRLLEKVQHGINYTEYMYRANDQRWEFLLM